LLGTSIAATAPASSSWFCDGCTATTVLVIMRPFRPRHNGADQAAYTLTATVPASRLILWDVVAVLVIV
ncbi:hypothetical protein, partial [Mycobacterium ulcerans]|uniref:hypothetical protein n=1 Tax=Mycobacterium ulcerans TaxID=1809 RepID=UPI001A8D09B5